MVPITRSATAARVLLHSASALTYTPDPNPIVDHVTMPQVPVQWLIPDLLPSSYFSVFVATEGCGKSLFSYAMAMALATGVEFLGRTPTRPRTVLYFDEENSIPDQIQYQQWAWHGLGRPNMSLLKEHFWPLAFHLGSRDWPERLEERVMYHQPGVIVIDTALSALPPLSKDGENDNATANRIINKVKAITRLTTPQCATWALKHEKRANPAYQSGPEQMDVRGAKEWLGSADNVIFMKRAPGPPVKHNTRKLHRTRLIPYKPRAFGLTEELHISPSWCDDGRGIRFALAP